MVRPLKKIKINEAGAASHPPAPHHFQVALLLSSPVSVDIAKLKQWISANPQPRKVKAK